MLTFDMDPRPCFLKSRVITHNASPFLGPEALLIPPKRVGDQGFFVPPQKTGALPSDDEDIFRGAHNLNEWQKLSLANEQMETTTNSRQA